MVGDGLGVGGIKVGGLVEVVWGGTQGDLVEVYRNSLKIDLSRFNGDQSWELALPVTYIVGTDGRIGFAGVYADYTARSEPQDVLAAVRAASAR